MIQNVYDNEKFFKEYDNMRINNKNFNANDLIEIPNFRKLVPNVSGKKILDLGCGYGENVKYYKELGASYVLGIDISKHMLDIALKENNVDGVEYKRLAMEDISSINNKFDIIISSLAFHYIKDYKKLLNDIYNLLNDNGFLVFSQDHPLRIANLFQPWMEKNYTEINGKWFLLLSDYNRIGLREKKWNGVIVQKYHRNFQEIINGLIENGFKIDKIMEPLPNEEIIKKVPKYVHLYDRPFFLFVKAHKENPERN